MSELKNRMIETLRRIVIPVLRKKQFKGAFPHFKRIREQQIDLLTFQFNRWGGSFVVEVAWCESKGWTRHNGELVPSDKVKVSDISPTQRLRLGSHIPEREDHWFYFEPEWKINRDDIALDVLNLVCSQGDEFWDTHRPAMVLNPKWPLG